MKRTGWGVALVVCALIAAGCRTATRVVRVDRVDLEREGGNRGYLVGTPPAESSPQKTTREMVETTIEIPSFYQPTRGPKPPVDLGMIAPPETELSDEGSLSYETYVVRKGETLSSIAARPEIYGNARRWRDIFDANRDLLKNPDRIHAGMTLKIPRGGEQDAPASDEAPATYRK